MCREERQRGNVAFLLLKGRAREAASLLSVGFAPNNLVTPIRKMFAATNRCVRESRNLLVVSGWYERQECYT